jgi:integrase
VSEYTVQRFRGGWAVAYPMLDDAGNPILDKAGKAKRCRERLYATDRPSAEAEARKRWAGGGDDEPWTVGRIVESYMAAREEAGILSTGRQRDAWKAMKGYWATVDPQLIDDKMAKGYAKQRDRANATVRYELSMLSVALKWAADNKKIQRVKALWRPDVAERKVRALTRPQFRKWFKDVKAPHARLYVRLGIATMARPAAILELRWEQIDWEHSHVDLNPRGRKQTRKRRPVVPLNAETMDELKKAFDGKQSEFIIERGASQVKSIKKAFLAASERSGVKVTPYMLRHTGAVWAAEAGVSMHVLAQYMGHDDDSTTQKHYARFSPDYLRTVSDAVQLGALEDA